ncbi:MAG: ABC transporter ATP-binding protein [candidate division WOR-3 bacterium]
MIILKNIVKKYPSFKLGPISFEIKKGEIFALLGPNGAGKTTTVKLILELLKPVGGEIYKEKDIKIGFVLENEKPFENLNPFEYLEFFRDIYKISIDIYNILEMFDLKKYLNKINGKLSKGNQKKLCLAKAIIGNPNLLILDEPLEGIEPLSRKEIKDFLVNYVKNDRACLITSHELYEMENFCSVFGIIYDGKFLGKWKIEEIKNFSLEDFYLKKIKELKDAKNTF